MVLAALASLLTTNAATATTDGGHTPRLLAFAGADEQFAIVALESVQEPCGLGPCSVFVLDLTSTTYRERWPHEPAMLSDELSVGKLVEELVFSASIDGAPKLEPIRLVEAEDGEVLAIADERVTVDVTLLSLRVRRRVASMRPYARGTQQSCGMFSGGDRCSSCEEKGTTLNGEQEKAWVCADAPGTFAKSGAPCDCHAEATVLAFFGAGFIGREILVAPYRLAQNVMNGPGSEPDVEVVLREARLHRNRSGTPLVLAGAVHAPMANGTWFPLIAYRTGEVAPPLDGEPTPMTPGAGDDVVVELPPAAPGSGGCAGCAIASDPARHAWLLGVLLAIAAFARRRT